MHARSTTGNWYLSVCGVVVGSAFTIDDPTQVTCEHCKKTLSARGPYTTFVSVDELKSTDVARPAHYTAGKVECIDAIEAATSHLGGVDGFLTGQVIKYVWRWKLKNGVQDLEKAKWYLERLIDRVKGGQS